MHRHLFLLGEVQIIAASTVPLKRKLDPQKAVAGSLRGELPAVQISLQVETVVQEYLLERSSTPACVA